MHSILLLSKEAAIKHQKVKPGDIVSIPLTPDAFAAGIVLHVSKEFRNAMMIGIYDKLFLSKLDITSTALPDQFIETPNYTSTQLVTKGDWEVVAHNSKLLEGIPLPKLRAAGTVYRGDEVVEQLHSLQELRRYPEISGQGKIFIERKLRQHFNLATEQR